MRKILDKMPVRVAGLKVEVENGKIEKALRILNKKVKDEGRLKVLKEKEFFEKPTQRRKREAAAARKRWEKKLVESTPTRY